MSGSEEGFEFHPPTVELELQWLVEPHECVWCGRVDATDFRDWVEVFVNEAGPCWEPADARILDNPQLFCNLDHAGRYLMKVAGGQALGGTVEPS